jgi:hypothetical protein
MAAAFPGMDGAPSYPTMRRRCASLARTIAEIAQKRAAGVDLVPDEKALGGRGAERIVRTSPDEEFADRLHRIQRSIKPQAALTQAQPAADAGSTACQ